VAAALAHSVESKKEHIEVQMPGGRIDVDFPANDSHPRMTGSAVVIADLVLNTEVLK
jgi:diaminopimelate epimerase